MKLLSQYGGGIRGVLEVRLMRRIAAEVPGFVDLPDKLGGASIGGINALWLAAGKGLDELEDFYQQNAKTIFKSRGVLDDLTPDELFRANFAHEDIYGVLSEAFGDLKMGELGKPVLIPSFDMVSWDCKFWTRGDKDVLVRDVARMTSAAPTYWPTHLWNLDGGVFNNNPSDSLVAEAHFELRSAGVADPCKEISCLSISTGRVPHTPPSEDPDWDAGVTDMLPLLLDVIFDGGVRASHGRTKRMLGERYHLVEPTLPGVISLSDASEIPLLLRIADLFDIDEAVEWVQRNWLAGPA